MNYLKMRQLNFFSRTFLLLLAIILPLACGSDDDAGGGETPFVDTEATYTVTAAKEVGAYTTGESLATVSDADGAITSATLVSGSELPAGTSLDGATGELTVSDAGLLMSGTYSIDITTEDAMGGTSDSNVMVTFNENSVVDAVYTVADAKAVGDYVASESIATVSDADGDITSAVLEDGSELPAGTALNEITGEITVVDPALLTPGMYEIGITTVDANDGSTTNTVTLVFNENPVIANINSGGDEVVFTDITFSADQFFVGTSMSFAPDPSPEIENTDKAELYVTERFGTDFGYEFALENATYKVTLHFVELYWGAPGLGEAGGTGNRIFDVSIEGNVVLDDYDIFTDVGALFATEKEFEVTLEDGMMNIDLMSSVDNAKISAIEIEKI